jgi:adenylate kinase
LLARLVLGEEIEIARRGEIVARLLKRAADEGRTDDSEEVIRNRLRVYNEQTAPLTALYAERGLLVRVDGTGPIEEVAARVEKAIMADSR